MVWKVSNGLVQLFTKVCYLFDMIRIENCIR